MMSSSSSSRSSGNKNNLNSRKQQQFPSFILFASVILFVNLCPFNSDFSQYDQHQELELITPTTQALDGAKRLHSFTHSVSDNFLTFAKLMFTNPIRLGKRATRFTQSDAAMLGKMAKVWYIKKKIKKLGKKLKKHTIAVPVFTAIPIYEHSYYPQQPHVTHLSQHHMGSGHHAAASSYAPTFVAAANNAAAQPSPQVQLATSASSIHQQAAPAFRMSSGSHHHGQAMFHPHPHLHPQNAHNQIINSYAPSPPLYVDEAGGLYGHYGNAYGRYDGGYQVW